MNSKLARFTTLTFFPLVLGFYAQQNGFSQSSTASQSTAPLRPLPGHSPNGFAGAENRWQLTAVFLRSQVDSVDPNIRAARNKLWQPLLKHERDMEAQLQAKGMRIVRIPESFSTREIPDDPSRVWVIAKFDHYLVEAIDPDATLIYTEMRFSIEDVIYQPSALSLSPGGSFDVDIEGGRVKTPKGVIVSWQVEPHRYFVQPGHTYLLNLIRQSEGDLYFIRKQWDLSTGYAVPDQGDEINRAADGHSQLNKLTKQQVINYLQSILPKDSAN